MSQPVKRILMFEDDYESMKDLKEQLEEMGCSVELSAQRSVLERLSCEKFDLIIVDSMIQSMSLNERGEAVENVHYEGLNWRRTGLEFLARLRRGDYTGEPGKSTPKDVPVIVLSAVIDRMSTAERGTNLRKEIYVEKPFRLIDLVQKIQSMIQE